MESTGGVVYGSHLTLQGQGQYIKSQYWRESKFLKTEVISTTHQQLQEVHSALGWNVNNTACISRMPDDV